MRIAAGRSPGRRHVRSGVPCQDAYATLDQGGRAAAALADGLGSAQDGGTGAQLAADAAVASLEAEATWDPPALERAFAAAHARLLREAGERGVPVHSLATTLQLATLEGGRVRAAMVGDGAVVLSSPAPVAEGPLPVPATAATGALGGTSEPPGPAEPGPREPAVLLLAPASGEYANEVVPITAPGWQGHLRKAAGEGDAVLLFSDGLTRLLLGKDGGQWRTFAPFYEAFLPQVRAPAFDPELVQRFLDRPDVARSWDDDKCLVVMAHGSP